MIFKSAKNNSFDNTIVFKPNIFNVRSFLIIFKDRATSSNKSWNHNLLLKTIFLGDRKWSFGWTDCERAFDMLLSRNIQKKVLGNSENLWFPTFISRPTAICSNQRFWWNYQHQKIWRKLEKFGKLLWLFLTLDTKCPDCLTVYCLLLFNSRTDNATISIIFFI